MTIRQLLPYSSLRSGDELVKIQSHISLDDKRTVLTALGGDDGVYSLVIQHAFKRTAEFIRKNKLNVYDSSSHARVLDYIRNGSDPCTPGCAAAQPDAGPAQDSEPAPASTRSVRTSASQGNPRGKRTKESSQVRKTGGAEG